MTPKILLVDDEESICNMIKLHFQTEGYLVYTAFDSEEAVRIDGQKCNDIKFLFRKRNNLFIAVHTAPRAGGQRTGTLQKDTKLY